MPSRLLGLLAACLAGLATIGPLAAPAAAALGAATPLAADPGAAPGADLFDELRTFPGVVLLPPSDLVPFDGLEPWRVELNRPRPGSTAIVRGRYLVQYRIRDDQTGAAQVGGVIGRREFDQTVTTLAERSFRRCAADAPYCAENVAGQDGAPLASEVFRGLVVADGPAVVEHVTCCGGHYWSLGWYDPARDMSYELVLVGTVADQFGTAIGAENEPAARRIGAIAGQLAPLE